MALPWTPAAISVEKGTRKEGSEKAEPVIQYNHSGHQAPSEASGRPRPAWRRVNPYSRQAAPELATPPPASTESQPHTPADHGVNIRPPLPTSRASQTQTNGVIGEFHHIAPILAKKVEMPVGWRRGWSHGVTTQRTARPQRRVREPSQKNQPTPKAGMGWIGSYD